MARTEAGEGWGWWWKSDERVWACFLRVATASARSHRPWHWQKQGGRRLSDPEPRPDARRPRISHKFECNAVDEDSDDVRDELGPGMLSLPSWSLGKLNFLLAHIIQLSNPVEASRR